MLMFYFITQLFRYSPTTNTTGNVTLPNNPNNGFKPGNLFATGELLVSIRNESYSFGWCSPLHLQSYIREHQLKEYLNEKTWENCLLKFHLGCVHIY